MINIDKEISNAISLGESGQLADAISIFYKLLDKDPKNCIVLYNLGVGLNELRDFHESERILKKLLEIDPDYPNAKVALGYSLFLRGDYPNAEKLFTEAIEKDPSNVYALRNIGTIFAKKGDYINALKYYLQAEEFEPTSRPVLYGLALAYYDLKDFEKSNQYVDKILDQCVFDQFEDLAKELKNKLSELAFHQIDTRFDAVFYCLAAIEKFDTMNLEQIRGVVTEIAILGQSGLSTSDPDRKYQIRSFPGDFTGLQLVCYMYVGLQLIDPNVDLQFDLSKEYQIARMLNDKKKTGSS